MPTVKKNAAAAATTDTAAAAPKEKKAKATKATKATKAQPKARAKATEAQPAAATAPNGLTGNEAKVLAVLAKQPTGKTLGRAAMVEATGIKGGWSRMLGAATKEDGGVRGDTSLQARGLIKCTQVEGTRELQYAITAAGKAALKKGSK